MSAASLDTNVEARDAHLRSQEFFDVEAHPRDARRDEQLRVQKDRPCRTGRSRCPGQLNRRDWGMSFSEVLESGRLLISDKVKLTIDISATKRS